MKPKQTSKFSRVKSKGQLVELEYKDLLSPSGRSLQKNEKQKARVNTIDNHHYFGG